MSKYTVALALGLLSPIMACGVPEGVSGSSSTVAAEIDEAFAQGTIYYDETLGFPGVCEAPCFSVAVDFEVWGPNDPQNPQPEPGNNTYIYTLTHEGGAGPFVPEVVIFEVAVDGLADRFDAGWCPYGDSPWGRGCAAVPGVQASSVAVDTQNGVVTWEFYKDTLGPGETTTELLIWSPLGPGYADISIGSQAALTASGEIIGPVPADSHR